MQVSIIHNKSELAPYRSEWDDILLENGNTNPYVTPDWISGWWDFFGEGKEMCILVLSDSGRNVGFCPLMRMKKRLHQEIRFIGHPQAGRMNLIVRRGYEQELSSQVIGYLMSQKGPALCTLHGLSKQDECYGFLRQALGSAPCCVQTQQSSVIDLIPGGEEEFFRVRRQHYRIKKTISREKALSRLCCVTFEKVSPAELETIFTLHQKRWQKKIDGNGFGKGRSKEFFSWLASGGRSPFWHAEVYLLKAGSRPIGFAYGIECGGRFTFYRIAHDDDFAFFKPGMIVTKKMLEQCFKAGYVKFDFSTGDEEYKKSWTDGVELIDKITFAAAHPSAQFLVFMARFTDSVRRALKKNAALVRFKRVTAGKMRYFFSPAHALTLLRRLGDTIRLQGWRELSTVFMPSRSERRVRYSVPSPETAPSDCVLSLREAPLEETELISSLTVREPGKIVRRYAKGGRCQILMKGEEPVGYAWISQSKVTDGKKLLWQPEKTGDHCCYDICVYKKQPDQVCRQALLCLARQPLPGRHHTMELILRRRDRKLWRAAEELFQARDQLSPRAVLRETPNEI